MRRVPPTMGGRTLLQEKAVKPATRAQYQRALQKFAEFCQEKGVETTTSRMLDEALCDYLDDLYLQGLDSGAGSIIHAALCLERPEVGRNGVQSLPGAALALKGFRLAAPGGSRLPLPFLIVAGMSMALLAGRNASMALRLLVTFALYLRPSEADSILVKDLVRPVGSKQFGFKSFAIVLHPFERGEPSKVKSYDDTLLLDGHLKWLGPQLAKHAAGARATRKMFEESRAEFGKEFARAAKAIGLDVTPHEYQLRHGGAAHDLLHGLRERGGVKARGRWVTDASLVRYGKQGKVQAMLASLPPVGLAYCERSARLLQRTLQSGTVPEAPPF